MKKNEIDHGVSIEDKNKIIGVLNVLFSDAKIYLYGSRVKGMHSDFSDIDVAIDAKEAIPLYAINEARSMLAETNTLYKVDVVDVHNIPQVLKKRIFSEGVIWATSCIFHLNKLEMLQYTDLNIPWRCFGNI